MGSLSHSLHNTTTEENNSVNSKHKDQSCYDYILFPFHVTLLCMLIILCCLYSPLPTPSSSVVSGMAFLPHKISNWLMELEILWLWEQKIPLSTKMQNCHGAIDFHPFKHYLGLQIFF